MILKRETMHCLKLEHLPEHGSFSFSWTESPEFSISESLTSKCSYIEFGKQIRRTTCKVTQVNSGTFACVAIIVMLFVNDASVVA